MVRLIERLFVLAWPAQHWVGHDVSSSSQNTLDGCAAYHHEFTNPIMCSQVTWVEKLKRPLSY
jgi:hypothetical protein